ncbi:MAG: DNA-3-methyladenine glycosylase 2 family protein, partial [Actinomycetota bacterium]|nr:DNA-3-methyladenine glycosylase 2 family protein [Actinomycetota bacterium]
DLVIEHDPSNRRVVVAPVDQASLSEGVAALSEMDSTMAGLAERNGVPPLWPRDPGFPTMVRLILEQQVSLASADAAFRNLEKAIGRVEPEGFLDLDDAELRGIGFSRQKTGYVQAIAAGLLGGSIDLIAIGGLDDAAASDRLLGIRGIGPWTAACYLLFALRRPDVWPPGDRALQVSMGRVFNLDAVPNVEESNVRAAAWRPLRSVAARMLWYDYLGGPGE